VSFVPLESGQVAFTIEPRTAKTPYGTKEQAGRANQTPTLPQLLAVACDALYAVRVRPGGGSAHRTEYIISSLFLGHLLEDERGSTKFGTQVLPCSTKNIDALFL